MQNNSNVVQQEEERRELLSRVKHVVTKSRSAKTKQISWERDQRCDRIAWEWRAPRYIENKTEQDYTAAEMELRVDRAVGVDELAL